CQKCDTVPWTF
nr:immunoglobulin light chain junction region [Macaca mulatta]MOV82186.1 immunoglobulin light chain junction region [Macaca mulatta]